METTTRAWLAILLLIFLSACQSKPRFINHPAPNLAVSMDLFTGEGLLADFGCTEIWAPSSFLGGLDPAHPIAICAVQHIPGEGSEELAAEIESGQFFYYTGGLLGSYIRYLVYQDGGYRLLKTEEDFRELFAPVESAEEALSYVLALRNLAAYYGLEYDPAFEYEVRTIEDTYVTPDADGYLVHLFAFQQFGCGPHWTSEVDVHVSPEGAIEERTSRQIYRDPAIDDLCID